MTEQAKLTYLQEKIREATRKERGALVAIVLGAILIATGGAAYTWKVDYYQINYPFQTAGLVLLVCGIILFVLGIVEGIHYTAQKGKSMEELKTMATVNRCPKCGKQMLQMTPYCPFCGNPLET